MIRFNHIALAVLGLFALSIIDSCQGIMESSRIIKVVKGQSAPINGRLGSDLPALERLHGVKNTPEELAFHLTFATDCPDLSIHFEELTGRMWRGKLLAAPSARPGTFELAVHQRDVPLNEADFRFQVHVFPNTESLQASEVTFSKRFLGIQPLWLTLVLLPLGLLMLYLAYLRGGAEEEKRQAEGIGEIYKLARKNNTWEIVFGLGSKHGIQSGQQLPLVDKKHHVIAQIIAEDVQNETSQAHLDASIKIKPTDFVTLPQQVHTVENESGN